MECRFDRLIHHKFGVAGGNQLCLLALSVQPMSIMPFLIHAYLLKKLGEINLPKVVARVNTVYSPLREVVAAKI